MSGAARAALAAWLLPVCAARAACGAGATGTAWQDGFADLGCLRASRQAVSGPEGRGVTVTPAKQTWRPRGAGRDVAVLAPGARSSRWSSPVLDTLSPDTAWIALEWRVEQNERLADPSCACPTPGSPLTPVTLAYGAGESATPGIAERIPAPLAQAGRVPLPANLRGRYLRVEAELRSRAAAVEVDPALAPGPSAPAFAGVLPALTRLAVEYFPRAAEIESRAVAPVSVRVWGRLAVEADVPPGARLAVDVLADDGAVLLEDAAPGTDLGGAVSAFLHPALRLRARLAVDPADPSRRPVLARWGVAWRPLTGRLELDRAAFRPAAGESVRGLVAVDRPGSVRVRVRDGAHRAVRMLADGESAARAAAFAWDGRDAAGALARPGTYFVTATTPSGSGTRRVELR